MFILTGRSHRLIITNSSHQAILANTKAARPCISVPIGVSPIPFIPAFVKPEARPQRSAVRQRGLAFCAVPAVVVHGVQTGRHVLGPCGVGGPAGNGVVVIRAACQLGMRQVGVVGKTIAAVVSRCNRTDKTNERDEKGGGVHV